jgi:hypothetical protein
MAGTGEARQIHDANSPARMMPVNHKSMMKVVDSATRASETGANTMVPNEAIQSPAMWMPRLSVMTPK